MDSIRDSRGFVVAVSVIVILALIVGEAAVLLIRIGQGSTTTTAPMTTIEDILAGKFPSAQDKQGTGGERVSVSGLFVIYVHNESDGDWHVAVTDGKVPLFITEIIPRDQAAEGRPVPGTTIDETGTPFCDSFHAADNWHGYTCWEIHPLTSWRLSNRPVTPRTTPRNLQGLNVSVSYTHNPARPGSVQNITVKLSVRASPVVNQTVFIHVDYASGVMKDDFTCETYSDGTCSVYWTLEAYAPTGTYSVTVDIDGNDFGSTFEVVS